MMPTPYCNRRGVFCLRTALEYFRFIGIGARWPLQDPENANQIFISRVA